MYFFFFNNNVAAVLSNHLVASSRRSSEALGVGSRLRFRSSVYLKRHAQDFPAERDHTKFQWTCHQVTRTRLLATIMLSTTPHTLDRLARCTFVLLLPSLVTPALGVLHQRSPVAATCKRSMFDGDAQPLSSGGEATVTGQRVPLLQRQTRKKHTRLSIETHTISHLRHFVCHTSSHTAIDPSYSPLSCSH